jgi:glutathione synthase
MSHRFVFVMDPVERIDVRGDSTYVLMLEAERRGHRPYYAQPSGLEIEAGRAFCWARPIAISEGQSPWYVLGEEERLELDTVQAVFMRKDPPIDMEYIASTYVLDLVDRDRVVMVNDPQSLRDCNEKLFALRFPELVPPSWVTRRPKRAKALLAELGKAVVKPLNGAGGAGVMLLEHGGKNVNAILDMLTQEGRAAIEVQAYLPKVSSGDRRVLLVGGVPIGVINRRPAADDLRSNMHVGGTAEPARLDEHDLRICAAIGPELVRRGLPFVGIDVIDGRLTEINVTSPTGFQELARFTGIHGERLLLDWVEREVDARA